MNCNTAILIFDIDSKVKRKEKLEAFSVDNGWSKSSDFLLHSVSNTWVHGGTTGEDVVTVQVLTDVNVALHHTVVCGLMDTGGFHSNEGWLEEGFWATESFVSDGDDLAIRQLIALFEGGGGGGGHLGFEVQGNI